MKILITGGLGFIGVNAALHFCENNEVHILDNMSRKGNIENSKQIENKNITLHVKDIRNFYDVERLIKDLKPDVILHLAGQVAVTFSVSNPREDFEINSVGTFNILESLRLHSKDTILLFSSTNKVYGKYETELVEGDLRYNYDNLVGVSEKMSMDFHSPYGCSKGSADQYVRDYNRIYGLKTVVLRQSCIYGENQFGIEDQGWVAWFTIASHLKKKFYIYGNGKQVRDILYIKDLIDLYELVIKNIDVCSGEVYNVGGGPNNTLSLLELINFLETKYNNHLDFEYSDWRPGDQMIYVSDISKIKEHIGWEPKTSINNGLNSLSNWVSTNEYVKKIFG
jgi:CDP-paratose 2-epimerase